MGEPDTSALRGRRGESGIGIGSKPVVGDGMGGSEDWHPVYAMLARKG